MNDRILLRGGRVIDPGVNVDAVLDVLVAGGVVAKVAAGIQLDQRERAYTRVWSRIIAESGFQPQ